MTAADWLFLSLLGVGVTPTIGVLCYARWLDTGRKRWLYASMLLFGVCAGVVVGLAW